MPEAGRLFPVTTFHGRCSRRGTSSLRREGSHHIRRGAVSRSIARERRLKVKTQKSKHASPANSVKKEVFKAHV